MRKTRKHLKRKTVSRSKKVHKVLIEKKNAWKSFWNRYCQM
jgi:hypothetical protein